MLAVTGLILEMGDGSSFIGREISALTTVKQNNKHEFRKDSDMSSGLQVPFLPTHSEDVPTMNFNGVRHTSD